MQQATQKQSITLFKSLLKPFLGLCLFLLLALQIQGALSKPKSNIERFDLNEYQVFVKNWDDSIPVLCTKIKSESDWKQWISPAAIMGQHKPYQPEKKFFDRYQLVLISKIAPHPEALQLVKTEAKLSVLRIEYTEKMVPENSALFKASLILQIPQSNSFKTIDIVEKDKQGKRVSVCTLN